MLKLFRRSPAETKPQTDAAVERTRRTWFRRVSGLFERSRIDDDLWDELEELLIGADVGVATTELILGTVKERVRREGVKDPQQARDILRDELCAILQVGQDRGVLWRNGGGATTQPHPAVVLVVGVNGTGKTTSIAKLAHAYRQEGQRVLLAAADTFRAAAIDQLRVWGERVGAEVIAHRPGADPGAVVFDALSAAQARNVDLVIVDTAGRLHTKVNLMEELRKVVRVMQRKDPTAPHEVLLVLDATTGQNGLAQARAFTEAVGVTGVFLAKLDGTAKGGIVFAICSELGIPIRFVGTGERADAMMPFSPEGFVDALFTVTDEE